MATNSVPDVPLEPRVSRATQPEQENARLRGDLRMIGRRLAHDLRTPLNSISVASQALRDPSLFGHSLESLAQAISAGVSEASGLIDRLSPVLLATVADTSLQPINMEEIVRDALQRAESRLLQADATVSFPPTWPTAIGVAPWLELVWLNLVSNSLDHGGARVRIQLGADVSADQARFWIRDSGDGIPLETQAQLFHPFHRLGELNAPRTYGLSIVHRLVHLQAGHCGYDPQPAPGGTFFFTLPRG